MGREERVIYKAKGKALWAKLVEPDYEYKEEGEFSVKIILSEEAADALREQIDPLIEAKFNETVAAAKNPKAAIKALIKSSPIREHKDENGDATGDYEITVKRRALIIRKSDGKEFKQVIPIFVGKGIKAPSDIQIGNGSEIVATFTARSYFMGSTKACGVTLDLEAVLIRHLVQYVGRDASNLFDDADFDGADEFVDSEPHAPGSVPDVVDDDADGDAGLPTENDDIDF